MNVKNVYLFSIGINKYASDNISNLNKCVKDVSDFQKTLIKLDYVSETKCVSLYNSEATRKNIFDTFRTHFSQLEDGDIAVLHFSGHGSYQPTNEAFIIAGYEPLGGKDEALVCYDSKQPGIFNIADKELRLLISELQTKKKTSFVGIFDCCHAGSMLRDDQFMVKTTSPYSTVRCLEAYLDGAYKRMLDATGNITIPQINYISLTACSPTEKAYEGENGGVFTNALIRILNQSKLSTLSYSKLHYLSQLIVEEESNNRQCPYLEYWNDSIPYQLFLRKHITSEVEMPMLICKGSDWIANAGAIHGVEISMPNRANIPIFDKNNPSRPIGYGSIIDIFVEETIIAPTWINSTPTSFQNLYVGLYSRKIPITCTVKKEIQYKEKDIELLKEEIITNSHFIIAAKAKYELVINQNILSLYFNQSGKKKLLIGLESGSELAMDWLTYQLSSIAKWENTLHLSAPKYSNIPLDSVSFYFSYWSKEGLRTTFHIESSNNDSIPLQQIDIPYDSDEGAIFYQIDVEHNYHSLHGLYFYLIHLDRKYQIKQKNEHYIKPVMKGMYTTLYNSQEWRKGLGIADLNLSEVDDHFILLGSETPLRNPYSFFQSGFGNDMGKIISPGKISISKSEIDQDDNLKTNWLIKKLTVHLIRKNKAEL